MSRLLPHPALSVTLALVWLLLVNRPSIGALIAGGIIGLVVPWLTSRWWPDRPPLRFGRAMIGYVAVVLFDVAVANFQVAALILFRPLRQFRPAWLIVPLDLRAPEAVAMLAGTISLTPGTVSADLSRDGRHLLVHALDVADPDAEIARIKQRYEARLARIFR